MASDLRVLMLPHWENIKGHGESGIKTVIRKYFQHFPDYGIGLVGPNDPSFDVLAIHAGMSNKYDVDAPIVSHIHGAYWTGDYQDTQWQQKANRDVIASARYATRITVPSEWVAMCFRRDMHIDPVVVPHGVDWASWQDGVSDEGYVLWNKNRNTDACDPRPVLELAQRFPEVRFLTTFAPEGSPPNVKATGTVPHDVMKKMILGSMCYLSSTKETAGIGTLEAMAAGKPILGFGWGGNQDFVRTGVNGYLARPMDFHELADGLTYVMTHRKVLGDNSRDMAKVWTWEKATRKATEVYYNAMRAHNDPHEVTVVIPCYNKVSTLGRAVYSALGQTVAPAKIVIVNNNSTDDSWGVAKQIEAENPGIVMVVNEDKQGVAHARNRGVELATTRYICCLDADDEIAPRFLEACVDTLRHDTSIGLAYTRLTAIAPDGKETVSAWPGEYSYDRFLQGSNQVPTCCVFRKELFARLGGYRQRYAPHGAGAEDADFWFRMGSVGYRGKLATGEALFRYYLGGAVSGNPTYHEVNWRKWHPWVADGSHPFASVAAPHNGLSHAVRPYDNPRISVIVPVADYHRHTLVDAMDSIEGQTFRDWEVIVVADGFSIPQAWHDAYPYAHFIEATKRGAGAARNVGAEKATAPYLLFLDADDWLTPDALSVMYHAVRTHPGHIIYGDYLGHAFLEPRERERLRAAGRLVSFDEKTNESVISYSAMEYDCELAVKQPHLNADGSFYIWNLVSSLVPKLYHDEIGGMDESMTSWEDWDYWLRLAWAGKCFIRVPRPLVEYRFYTGQRRALANPNENGNDARQLSGKLIQYLLEKRGRSKIMPCGGCKKHTQTYSSPTPMPQMAQSATERSISMGNVSSDAFVTVELVDGNEGDHPISFGGQFYGYHSNGDRFKMLREHAVHLRAVRILNDSDMFPASDVAPQRVAPPAPQPITAMREQREAEVVSPVTAERTITLQPEVFDFTRIWGINEERQELLLGMGIRSLDGFMAMDTNTLAEAFDLQPANIARMMKSAEKLR